MERGNYVKKTDELFVYEKIDDNKIKKSIFTSEVYKLSDGEVFINHKLKEVEVKENKGISMF